MGDVTWPVRSLLGRLAGSAREELLSAGVARTVRSGQIILKEGAEESYVVLLEDAITKVTVGLSDGRQALLDIRVSGDLVGEMSALNGTPRSATVTACQDSRIRILHRAQFRACLRGHPDVAMAVAGIVADKLRWANDRRTDFAAFPVRVRLARVLRDIATAYGRWEPSGLAVDLHLTQAELGTLCGAAEVSLQKAMSELRKAQIVVARYRGFVVRDTDALREAAQLDGPDAPNGPGRTDGRAFAR